MKRCLFLPIVCLCLTLAVVAVAQDQANPTTTSSEVQVPRVVKFGGTVKDDAGHARSGVVGITFALYKDQQGGAPLWLETQNVQADSKGNYTVLLGSTTSEGLPADIFSSNDARWLGVQVEGQQEQARTLLVSAPYALKALDAETLGGKPASAFQLATAASNGSGSTPALTEQANEIVCASGTACLTASIPVFASNGGSAKITNSIIGQSGTNINVAGAINAQGTSGNINASKSITAGGNVTATGNVVGNNLTAKNQFSATSGNFSGNVISTGEITGATLNSAGGVLGAFGNFSGNVSAANLSATGTVSGASGNFSGNVSGGNLNTNGTVSGAFGNFIGSVSASEFFGKSNSIAAVVGQSSADNGVLGISSHDANFQAAIFGQQTGANTETIGVEGLTAGALGAGVYGVSVFASNTGTGFFPTAGVWGDTGESGSVGVLGTVDDANALSGTNNSQLRTTLFLNNITSASGHVLTALSTTNGGHCDIDTFGDLTCNGTLTGAAKNFKIDHPLDPANKYLVHASVESSEMMNIYTGNIITDASGEATVALPDWFEALNTDFRYQLTVVGQFAQAIIGHKIENHQFQIKTNVPGVEVSWQVTGVRQDAYTKAHPLVVEQEKEQQVRGFYLHPQLYGTTVDKQIAHALYPDDMKRTTKKDQVATPGEPRTAVKPGIRGERPADVQTAATHN